MDVAPGRLGPSENGRTAAYGAAQPHAAAAAAAAAAC
jgi:hypothetical protein